MNILMIKLTIANVKCIDILTADVRFIPISDVNLISHQMLHRTTMNSQPSVIECCNFKVEEWYHITRNRLTAVTINR
uniref:Uncharacterized protein n=1 Tax=Ascaris lumbricoides TaxID=6252 RepID=A0A0M3HGS1_ASCLU